MTDQRPIALRSVEAFALRAPAKETQTPFGPNTGRQTVLVRVTDEDGIVGWGEAWGTFPVGGAPHRAGLIRNVLAPLLTERTFHDPLEAYRFLCERTRLLVLQAGEPGPIGQAIAGVDIALWDLAARRAARPLWQFLGGHGSGRIPAYASGIPAERGVEIVHQARDEGHRAFKVRLWGDGIDWSERLARVREAAGDAPLMADANQSWTVEQAAGLLSEFAGLGLAWMEEPIPADSPDEGWLRLKAASSIRLAGGENLRGDSEFDHALALGALSVVQPDACKWGGISGCLPLARRIREAGRQYCPHYLGGGIGLLASAHLLAAAGGDGLLEVDVLPNPLREKIVAVPPVEEGKLALPEAPGLGVEPDPEALAAFVAE